MSAKSSVTLFIQVLLLAIPIFFLKHIKEIEIKFSVTLFIIIFYGYAFFRLLEGYLQKQIQSKTESESKDRYVWLGILLQIFLLIMFYQYAKRLLEIVRS